jgi:hypothetical protein
MTTAKMFFAGVLLATLSASTPNAWAGPVTVGKLHNFCLELPDTQNAAHGDLKSVKAGVDAMYLQGYIAGVTDEMNDLAGVGMDFDWPKTNGELVDALCQYFTLHPEQWSWEARQWRALSGKRYVQEEEQMISAPGRATKTGFPPKLSREARESRPAIKVDLDSIFRSPLNSALASHQPL